MNPNNDGGKMCNGCGCNCHKVLPICAVLIGVAFLAGDLGWLSAGVVNVAWPILLIVGYGSKMCKCK